MNARRKSIFAALVACAIALPAAPSRAAIAPDATSVAWGNSTVVTFPHTVGVGMDRVMIVGVSIFTSNKTVSAITYAGQPLARLGFLDGGTGSNDRRMEMWRLVNPPIGTANLAVTMSGGAKLVVGAATFFGVNTLDPNRAFVSNEARTSLATLTVPSAPGELVIDCMSVQGNAATAVVGAGQTQLWNDYSRSNGGAVVGTASTEPGAASVTMTWNLSTADYWVLGAVSLKPAPLPPFQPDALVRLQTEGDAAYFYNYWYENPASLQVKSASVLAGVPAEYRIRFENDGLNADHFVVTGPGGNGAFDVQYLDGAGVDRTAAVTGGGYLDALLAPGASTTWTLRVTPRTDGNAGGITFPVAVTATSQGDATRSDQVLARTTCVSPSIVMTKSADLANVIPGQDIEYTVVATSTGLSDAAGIAVVDSIPDYAGFRVGSATFVPGSTVLSPSIAYSNDHGATWTYAPASGSCSAPAGYDYCVTHVRWTFSGTMPPGQSFMLGMAVRVK